MIIIFNILILIIILSMIIYVTLPSFIYKNYILIKKCIREHREYMDCIRHIEHNEQLIRVGLELHLTSKIGVDINKIKTYLNERNLPFVALSVYKKMSEKQEIIIKNKEENQE